MTSYMYKRCGEEHKGIGKAGQQHRRRPETTAPRQANFMPSPASFSDTIIDHRPQYRVPPFCVLTDREPLPLPETSLWFSCRRPPTSFQ
jgi:hypothetical protein